MKKTLFSLVVIAALQMSFIASSEADTPCVEEETSCLVEEETQAEFINCLAARANADRQRDQFLASGYTVENANRAFALSGFARPMGNVDHAGTNKIFS